MPSLEKKEEEQTNKQKLKKGKKEVHFSNLDVLSSTSHSSLLLNLKPYHFYPHFAGH